MTKAQSKSTAPQIPRIGDYVFSPTHFPHLDEIFIQFKKTEFIQRSKRKRFQYVNEVLLKLIQDAPKESFLLYAVVEFINRINSENILADKFHFSLFEFWLNHFSLLDEADNYMVRAKIAGKYVPRDDYQVFFPIGMGNVYAGTHFVAAHLSPDVDTMVASFWGWMDAFAARVGNAQHLWSLPGGPPDSPVTRTFMDYFGLSIFDDVAHVSGTLTLKALDLITKKGMVKKTGSTSISALESSKEKAVILVDADGYYLGDWHSSDVDPIRKIIIRFKSCLRWFENNLHVQLISLFAKKDFQVVDIAPFLSSVFGVLICDCEPFKEFTERQKRDLNDFYKKVLGLDKGLKSTFGELNQALSKLSVNELLQFQKTLESLPSSTLFDAKGHLIENRPEIFNHLEQIIHQLDHAIHFVRDYAERLDVAMNIKEKVLGLPAQHIHLHSDIEDIKVKLREWEFLTVVISEDQEKLYPIGIIWATDINKSALGTVTFRDFCNQEEVKMAPYLSPISVVDHHKTSLKTSSAPMALVGDAQSCNVLVAEQAFNLNAPYSLAGMPLESIDRQLQNVRQLSKSSQMLRLQQRLLQRHVAGENKQEHFIHPDRELLEYFCFLHAILDDTDLLTKVSKRDIDCIVELLNRIKTIIVKEETEVINLDGIPRDKSFCKLAAKRILHNPEMYSVYQSVYKMREKEIENNLSLKTSEQCESLFLDTKIQNGCCRVGQTKLFTINFPTFIKKSALLMDLWLKSAQEINIEHPEIDLHIHMISTISSASEVYEDKVGHYAHQDELWFWVPNTLRALDHLGSFLTGFQSSQMFGHNANLEFLQGVSDEVIQVFARDCGAIPRHKAHDGIQMPIVILRYPAGTLNSRKAKITPYLPRISP